MRTFKSLIGLILLLALSACLPEGDSDATNILYEDGAKCTFTGGDVCLQFFENISESNVESICLNESFNYSPTAEYSIDIEEFECSTEDELGRCVTAVGEFVYYTGSNWTSASAQSDCLGVQGGVFQ